MNDLSRDELEQPLGPYINEGFFSKPPETDKSTTVNELRFDQENLTINITHGLGVLYAPEFGLFCFSECQWQRPIGDLKLIAVGLLDYEFFAWGGACDQADPSTTNQCTLNLPNSTPSSPQQISVSFIEAAEAQTAQWYGGDLHVHTDHSSDGSLPRQCCDDRGPGNVSVSDQIHQAESEGLMFLSLTDHRTYDQHYDPLWTSEQLILLRGEEANGRPHATVHGALDTLVQGSPMNGDRELARVQQSIWDAHAQGAVWISAHPDQDLLDDEGQLLSRANAVGVDMVESLNPSKSVRGQIAYCETQWNRGYRFGVAGASDSHFRELWRIVGPGDPTTEILANDYSSGAILQGMRRGNSQIHWGEPDQPILTMSLDVNNDGQADYFPGDELVVPAGQAMTLEIVVRQAASSRLKVYQAPGRSVEPIFKKLLGLEQQVIYKIPLTSGDETSWVQAEIRQLGILKAITSPIFFGPRLAVPEGLALLPEDQGGDDGARVLFEQAGQLSGFASLADDAGQLHMVAELQRAGKHYILYRRYLNETKGWEAPRIINKPPYRGRLPKIAAREGRVAIVWQDENQQSPPLSQIQLVYSFNRGQNFFNLGHISSAQARNEQPQVALSARQQPIVAWQAIQTEQAFDIMLWQPNFDGRLNLSARGKDSQAANRINTRSARYPASVSPSLAADSEGRIIVAWQDNREDIDPLWTGQVLSGETTDQDNWQIYLRRFNPENGQWSGYATFGDSDMTERHPSVALNQNQVALAWEQRTQSGAGNNPSLQAALFDFKQVIASPIAITSATTGMAQRPALVAYKEGFRLAWYDSRSHDWRHRIMLAESDNNGRWQNQRMLNSPGISSWPSLAGDYLFFSNTRNQKRVQRDQTQGIYGIKLTSD